MVWKNMKTVVSKQLFQISETKETEQQTFKKHPIVLCSFIPFVTSLNDALPGLAFYFRSTCYIDDKDILFYCIRNLLLFEEVAVDFKLLFEHDLSPIFNDECIWFQGLGCSQDLPVFLYSRYPP